MARELQLIVYNIVDGEGGQKQILPNFSLLPGNTKSLPTKGCITFEIINSGTVAVFLWDKVKIIPGQAYQPPALPMLPVAVNIPVVFANDYRYSRNSADVIND